MTLVKQWIIIFTIIIVIIAFIYLLFYLNHVQKQKIRRLFKRDEVEIKLFNKFSVYKNGVFIKKSEWFGSKTRSVLFYLIFKDFQHKLGIPIDELHNQFWPDASQKELINRKNATLSRLRKVLRTADQKIVLIKNERYFFDWSNKTVKIDVCEFMNNVKEGDYFDQTNSKNKMIAKFEKAINIYKNGITQEYSYNWIDGKCSDMRERANYIAEKLIVEYIDRRDWAKIIALSDVQLIWDEYDKDAIKSKILALKNMDKMQIAQKLLNDFNKKYYAEIGEESNIKLHNYL